MNCLSIKLKLLEILSIALLLLFSEYVNANENNYIDIVGDAFRVAVGKSNVTYYVSFSCDGNIGGSYFYIEDDGEPIYISDVYTPINIIKVPTTQEEFRINAGIYYTKEVNGNLEPHFMSITKDILIREPIISAERRGIDRSYTADSEVPIHWNIDDDDNSGVDFTSVGADYLQTNAIDKIDDDLLYVEAKIRNTELDTSDCNFKIQVPSSLRIWKDQKKEHFWSKGGNTIEFINCNISEWIYKNVRDTNFFVEWSGNLDETRFARIKFYCNDVEFGAFEYKGYAATAGRQPFPSEREDFEEMCNLVGCQWCIEDGLQGFPVDINSISETVDPNFNVYGEHFVVTASEPLAPNIYTLVPYTYNGYPCKCISMDSFWNMDLIFDIDDDADAFFQSLIWPQHFLKNDSVYLTQTEVLYYTGPFAARAATYAERLYCYGSWAMFKSRFFGQPKLLHRANQLEQNRLILHKYVLIPNLEETE